MDRPHPATTRTDDVGDHDVGDHDVASVDDHDVGDEPTTWEPIDLGPWMNGEITQPQPSLGITRSDGLRLIYPGREHAVLGETECGKTWLALGCVAAELTAGHHVVYIHYEEGDPGSTIERLRLLDVDPAMITKRLRFVAPSRPARTEWVAALLDPAPALVVHDGVNEAMSLIGAEIKDVDGAAMFRRRLVTPFLRGRVPPPSPATTCRWCATRAAATPTARCTRATRSTGRGSCWRTPHRSGATCAASPTCS